MWQPKARRACPERPRLGPRLAPPWVLPALLVWLGAVAVWGSPIGADAGSGPLECPEVRRSPPRTAVGLAGLAGPRLLADGIPDKVKSAVGAARSLQPAVESALGPAGDWTATARALLASHDVIEAVAFQTPRVRMYIYRRWGDIHTLEERADVVIGAKGYWDTLDEFTRTPGGPATPSATAAAVAGGARVQQGGQGAAGKASAKATARPGFAASTAAPTLVRDSNPPVSTPGGADGPAQRLWPHPFFDCNKGAWMFAPFEALHTHNNVTAGVFIDVAQVNVDPCDDQWGALMFGGHRCDANTTECVRVPISAGFPRSLSYRCQCRQGFGPAPRSRGGSPPLNDSWVEPPPFTCAACPKDSPGCGLAGAGRRWDPLVRSSLEVAQAAVMATVLVLGFIIFKKRKCKVVASSMWTMLETLLLGALLMQTAVVLRFVEPSLWMCLLEPWCREMGFVVCYGSIILKLYRILVEFRTRKAHRWVLKDRDLLRHLGAMVLAVFAYLAALTAASLHFYNEGFQLLDTVTTDDGEVYPHCKVFWWDWVTQAAELVSLGVGLHLGWASRSFHTQFNERVFLCAALSVELLVSFVIYVGQAVRIATRTANLAPTTVLVTHFAREQASVTVVLALVFIPVLWMAHRQPAARSSLLPTLDSLGKAAGAEGGQGGPGAAGGAGPAGPGGFHSSDVDVTEVTLKDMNPDDIRAELKRLYTQLEILRNKQMRHNNPHISKRRGGRKVAHRRFSLQKRGSREKALHHRHMRSSARHHTDVEVTEAEGSRTPEDSVCSQEGPSAVFGDGPSGYSEYGLGYGSHGTPSVSYKGSGAHK